MVATNLTSPVSENVVERFARLWRSGRLAHAYLFIGPKDSGKTETALAVARLVNCEQNADAKLDSPCGQCPSCLKITGGNHPDVAVIDSGEEPSIKIAQVRELINRLQLRAYEARKKVYIIKNIETLTLDGSNALLKTLEEPSKDTLLILTTAVPERNLGTVKSRCHAIPFAPLSSNRLAELLAKDGTLNKNEAQFLANYAEGCVGMARRLNAEGFLNRKNEIVDNLIFQANNETYIKKILSDRDEAAEGLRVLLSWFKDLLLLKAAAGIMNVSHVDRWADLGKLEKQYSFTQIQEIIDQIVGTQKMLGDNLNVKIPFMLLREKIWARS